MGAESFGFCISGVMGWDGMCWRCLGGRLLRLLRSAKGRRVRGGGMVSFSYTELCVVLYRYFGMHGEMRTTGTEDIALPTLQTTAGSSIC